MDDESGYPYGYGNPHMPWIALSFFFPFLQTTVANCLALAKPSDIRWQSTDPFLRSAIMFLDQCKCLLVTNENHVQFFWTFVQTFVNNELFVHGCWHPKVFQAILHRLLMDEPWCNKKAQPICKLAGPFPNPNCFESFERETTYFWHG